VLFTHEQVINPLFYVIKSKTDHNQLLWWSSQYWCDCKRNKYL